MQKCEGGVQLEQYQEAARVVPQYLSWLMHCLPVEVAPVPSRDFYGSARRELVRHWPTIPVVFAVNLAVWLSTDPTNVCQREVNLVDSQPAETLHIDLAGMVPF